MLKRLDLLTPTPSLLVNWNRILNLSIHLHLVPSLRTYGALPYSPIRVHSVVLNSSHAPLKESDVK